VSQKHLESSTVEEILETQEESEEDEELIFALLVNKRLVSWAKTSLYSFLKEIHTAHAEKHKGYGRKLIAHIEKTAKAHGAIIMKTGGVNSGNCEAVGFFRSMGYGLRPIENDASGFLEGTKRL